MKLGQLRYFVALADTGSFTRAAAVTHVAQPSLSQQIRALEAELGGELVERHARGIRLTPAGTAFLPEARAAVDASDRARDAAMQELGRTPRTIDIVTVRSLAMTVVPQTIERWYRKHPEFLIRLHEYSSSPQAERAALARSGRLGIGPMPVSWSGPVRSLGWDELVAIVPADVPGAPFDPIPLASLSERGWVLYEHGHGLRPVIDAACAASGYMPRPAAETGQIETAARLAASGLGPSLVPRHTVPSDLEPAVRVLDPPLMWEVAAYSRTAWPRYVDAYLDLFRGTALDRLPPAEIQHVSPSEYAPTGTD